jgi:hypothetical protein
MDRVQSQIWLTASSFMVKYQRPSSYIKKPFLIYDFETDPIWISLYMRKILFSFLSVRYAFALCIVHCECYIFYLLFKGN